MTFEVPSEMGPSSTVDAALVLAAALVAADVGASAGVWTGVGVAPGALVLPPLGRVPPPAPPPPPQATSVAQSATKGKAKRIGRKNSLPMNMKAVRLHEIGGPEQLRIEEIDVPVPSDGEVVVRVHAAAFNRRDVFISQGLYPGIELPKTLGSDGAGVIEATGQAVVINPMLSWGEDPHVWGADASILGMPHDGTFAQYVCVPKENVFGKPAMLTMEEAAAIPLAALTAYRAMFTRGEIKASDTILIPGIGGGVQTFVLLFAKAVGARAIVTSGSEEKLERARALGADITINYAQNPEWQKSIKRGEVDLVVDSSGGDTLGKALSVLRPGGRAVLYGGTRPESTVRLFPIFWNHIDIRGTSMGSPADFAAMLKLFDTGLKPAIDHIYPMTSVVEAAQRMAAGDQFGKIVLTIP
jgi:zinc-binding alcohol dehydrogenase/oxidoreductase